MHWLNKILHSIVKCFPPFLPQSPNFAHPIIPWNTPLPQMATNIKSNLTFTDFTTNYLPTGRILIFNILQTITINLFPTPTFSSGLCARSQHRFVMSIKLNAFLREILIDLKMFVSNLCYCRHLLSKLQNTFELEKQLEFSYNHPCANRLLVNLPLGTLQRLELPTPLPQSSPGGSQWMRPSSKTIDIDMVMKVMII